MKRALLMIFSLLVLPVLSGCAAGTALGVKKEDFQNRLMMSTACDEMRADSQWFGLFGISTGIVEKDAKPVLEARCGRGPAPAVVAPAAAASAAK